MKTKRILKLLTLGIIGVVAVSCSSEDDYAEVETPQDKLVELKSRVQRIASDYGVRDIAFDDAVLMKNLDMSDEEIERTMKIFSGLKGHYTMEKKEGQTFKMKKQIRPRTRTASPAAETWSGSTSGTYSERDFSLDISLSYYYSSTENSYINGSISVRYSWYDPDNYWEVWEEENVNIEEEHGDFAGVEQFSYSALISFNSDHGFSLKGEVISDYSAGTLRCDFI